MKTVLFLLGELDDDDIDWMLEVGSRQAISPGITLIDEGAEIEHLYILL
jgi:CRP/FNR family transcriptional regulator, cyclic AMP receptor protein